MFYNLFVEPSYKIISSLNTDIVAISFLPQLQHKQASVVNLDVPPFELCLYGFLQHQRTKQDSVDLSLRQLAVGTTALLTAPIDRQHELDKDHKDADEHEWLASTAGLQQEALPGLRPLDHVIWCCNEVVVDGRSKSE